MRRGFWGIQGLATYSSLNKILVLYGSQTGNVEQMAKIFAERAREIQGVEVGLRKIGGEGSEKAGLCPAT